MYCGTQLHYFRQTSQRLNLEKILTETGATIKSNQKLFLVCLFIVPFLLINTFLFFSNFTSPNNYRETVIQTIIKLFIGLLIDSIISSFFTSWFLRTYAQLKLNEGKKSFDFFKSFKESFSYFYKIIIARIIVGIILVTLLVAVGLIIIIPLIFVFEAENYNLLMLIVLFALIVFLAMIVIAIVVLTYFVYLEPAIVIGNEGIISSLSCSYKLSKDYFKTTLGLVLVFGFISSSIQGAINNIFMSIPITLVLQAIELVAIGYTYRWYYSNGLSRSENQSKNIPS